MTLFSQVPLALFSKIPLPLERWHFKPHYCPCKLVSKSQGTEIYKHHVDIQFTFKTQFVKPSHIVYPCACSYISHYTYKIWQYDYLARHFILNTWSPWDSAADWQFGRWLCYPLDWCSRCSSLNSQLVEDLDCLACNISLSNFITSTESLFSLTFFDIIRCFPYHIFMITIYLKLCLLISLSWIKKYLWSPSTVHEKFNLYSHN